MSASVLEIDVAADSNGDAMVMSNLQQRKISTTKSYLPEKKLEAAQQLYSLVEPHSHALSLSELQKIFLQVNVAIYYY